MTQNEIKALKKEDKIGYRNFPGAPIIAATVTQNGPRLDPEGNEIPLMPNYLVIAIDGSTMTFSWEPVNFPDGIPQLFPVSAVNSRL